ncbi:hypothetical protein JTB14_000058 [Gonioctena quinquepunctata]|nr:hypothetical protein JTB14_000058 [Gonioctena quinquepunctata]
MWSSDASIRRSFFTSAISRERFAEISFLRFDDKLSRAERKQEDKLAAVSQMWNMFVSNCQNAFEPHELLTVDEQLVYTGKSLNGVTERNQGFRVVKDTSYHGSGRGITTDNFVTSVSLANYLLTNNLTPLGTVRKNKPDTPIQLSLKRKPVESSMFAFIKDLTMASYIPKK